MSEFGVSESDLKKMDTNAKAVVQNAADEALETPEPDASALYTEVFAS